ncbi:hypothetical protein [Prevotella sp. KH2C16]|uniref:hypothetical protein n=1 Tax=Prevotella sp. KH2C16 TaxID=1855325 RepID=UPI0008F031AB|nr:hypothetical protein [Prevotella sp. KH2C16]SFG30761.1 hypothetical protein SAMN05216383_10971 [Prevotella sp. KH2C16]
MIDGLLTHHKKFVAARRSVLNDSTRCPSSRLPVVRGTVGRAGAHFLTEGKPCPVSILHGFRSGGASKMG